MGKTTQRLVVTCGILVFLAGIAWATNFRSSLTYILSNGLEVSGGTVTLPANSIDFGEQAHVTIGADPAATCTAGQIHIDTDETDDTNCTTTADNSLCLCTATDTWTALENN